MERGESEPIPLHFLSGSLAGQVVWVVNLKEQALVKAVSSFEDIGFMAWHARVLRELSTNPISVKEISRRTGLFHYQIQGVLQDLLALQLIEYTRYGIQFSDMESVFLQLVECCEGEGKKRSFDWEAAFEVSLPRVMSLKRRYGFDE